MAEARSAVAQPRVDDTQPVGRTTWRDIGSAWKHSAIRSFYRTRNLISNGLWPTSVYNLGVGVGVFCTSMIGDWKALEPINKQLWTVGRIMHLPHGTPHYLQVLIISSASGFVFFLLLLYTRRWLLRGLLTYRRWMYETPHHQSRKTNLWAAVVWFVSGYQPTTFSCQKSLPRLPVPHLSATISRFLLSMEPLYGSDSEQMEKLRKDAQEFETGVGPKLQRLLVLKSYWAQNWVTDWWEKYVYLMSRIPVAINSNYYVLDHASWTPTTRQTSRAANIIYRYVSWKQMIDNESLAPLVIRNTVPLCMAQYEKLFATTRIPGVEFDELVRYKSKHIIVMCKGLYYKLDVYDTKCCQLSPQSLQKQLDWIVADTDIHLTEYSESSRSLAVLTALNRSDWAQTRCKFFSTGVNKESLDVLESALFHVVLEKKSFSSWSDEGKHLLHGDGSTVWFDKNFTAVFFANGRMGVNAEHSWGDAPVIGHLSEYCLTSEVLNEVYDKDGYVLPVTGVHQLVPLAAPRRLVWDISTHLEQTIDRALAFHHKNCEDLELVVIEHTDYGKGFIKTCSVSPDAYVQMALHLTYFKDSGGQFAMTYESSMTRLYRLGRTETVRSLTNDAVKFVRAMAEKDCTVSRRIELLRCACDNHQTLYRDAMNGRGIDRHLFGLFVLCKGLGYESEFLKEAMLVPWTLSTSQQPQQQIQTSPNTNNPKYKDKLCPGGGFGPVSDQGYGVSYMLPSDASLFFHISSKRSSTATNSRRFADLLFESLRDMRQLFDSSNGQNNN
jgi:carnitine O-palmitoyltransferase 1